MRELIVSNSPVRNGHGSGNSFISQLENDDNRSACSSISSHRNTSVFPSYHTKTCTKHAQISSSPKKPFSGRVVFVRDSATCKVDKIISQVAPTTSKTIKVYNSTRYLPELPSFENYVFYLSDHENEEEEMVSDYLMALSSMDASEIIKEVMSNDSTFNSYLRQEKMDRDTLFATMKVISKICRDDYPKVMEKISGTGLLYAIGLYFQTTFRGKYCGSYAKMGEFFENLTTFYSIIVKVGSDDNEHLKKLIETTKYAACSLNGRFDRHREAIIVQKLETLIASDPTKEKEEVVLIPAVIPVRKNFRQLSIAFTREDLDQRGLDVHLNEIVPKGRFENVDEYLETQFRLRRADLAYILRTGIQKYLQSKVELRLGKPKLKFGSVKMYEQVRFEGVTRTTAGQICLLVNIDISGRMKSFRWECSKRLILGSLLLFTANAFESFFSGFIVERSLEQLREHKLQIVLADETEWNETLFEQTFVMVETGFFYEQYFQMMEALKNFNEQTFPLQEYIIDAQCTGQSVEYIENTSSWRILGHLVELQNVWNWPTATEFGLDLWQYAALKHALTHKLCLIRGAPGTGKTLLTLKISRMLLDNIEFYPDKIKTPVLVICATNRDLDGFLEGITQSQQTSEIVRIAGRSRNHNLHRFDLRGRTKLISLRKNGEKFSPQMAKAIDKLTKCREQIDSINAQIKSITSDRGIVKYALLSQVFLPAQKEILANDDDVVEWLFSGQELKFNGENDDKDKATVVQHANDAAPSEDESVDERSIVNEDEVVFTAEKATVGDLFCCSIAEYEKSYKMVTEEYTLLKVRMKNLSYREIVSESDPYRLEKEKLEAKMNWLQHGLKTMKIFMAKCEDPQFRENRYQFCTGTSAWALPMMARWTCYWNWISILKVAMLRELTRLEYEYRKRMRVYDTLKRQEDLEVMRNAKLIGATIVGAVSFQDVLKELKPAIVICEGAAQILEAHLVAVLSNECKHLILLGDKELLKPASEVFELRVKYNSNLSLFERMLNNQVECVNLKTQYRMRPEIAALLTQWIYPNVENHPCVYKLEPVKGMQKNVYFLDHNIAEQEDDTASKKNIFEAEFAVELARYLILQGYNAAQITLLTSYEGQVYVLRNIKQTYEVTKNVSCFFVEDYAGCCNDIVILSLVRSNDNNQIGYLAEEGRVCTLLSRATKGLYIVGNAEMLSKCSTLWKKLRSLLESQDAIGKKIPLYCKLHNRITFVSTIEDFSQVREGGCSGICGELLPCGHSCPLTCHLSNKNHIGMICKERCLKMCPRNLHQCESRCDQKCQKCKAIVTATLTCGHTAEISCYEEESRYKCRAVATVKSTFCGHTVRKECRGGEENEKCTARCDDRLTCGHACLHKCHKRTDPDHLKYLCKKECERINCSRGHKCVKKCFEKCSECMVDTLFILPCGHEIEAPCSINLSELRCHQPCLKVCPNCKTKCSKKCYQECPPCPPCQTKVKKKIEECGHFVEMKCSSNPPKIDQCEKKCCQKVLCGHVCDGLCSKPCTRTEYKESVRISNVKRDGGHDFIIMPCDESDVFNPSDFLRKCDTRLACGHMCQGTYGECYEGRFHRTCRNKCAKMLVCGHSCKSYCEEQCPPCEEQCSYRCKHSKCPKKCGLACISCLEKCEWRCKHSTCTRKCGEICNREPCYENCQKKLNCGHPCSGFCGEPCPPKCRKCDKDTLSDMPDGLTSAPDPRFVLMVDCNHIFESKLLEEHFKMSEVGEIMVKGCPLCNMPVTKTLRFMNYVKKMYEHLNKVKNIIRGELTVVEKYKIELIEKFKICQHQCTNAKVFANKLELDESIENYLKVVIGTSIYGEPDLHQMMSIEAAYHVIESIVSRISELRNLPVDFVLDVYSLITFIILRLDNANEQTRVKVNRQHLKDLSDELRKYHKFLDHADLLQCLARNKLINNEQIREICNTIEYELAKVRKYSDEVENNINELFKCIQSLGKNTRRLQFQINTRKINIQKDENLLRTRDAACGWFICSEKHYFYVKNKETIKNKNCPQCAKATR